MTAIRPQWTWRVGWVAGRTAILFTQTASLPAVVAEAITQSGVGVSNVVVVGGPSAVSDAAYAAIARAAGWNGAGENPVARIYGQTRYETAASVADYVDGVSDGSLDESYRTVLVANGENFPDALAGGALAYRSGHLILLSRPPAAPQVALGAISDIDANCAILLGGPEALSQAVVNAAQTALTGGSSGGSGSGGSGSGTSGVWPAQAGGAGDDAGYSVSALPDGSGAIVTGEFTGTATFGATTLDSGSPNDGAVFVGKLDTSGNWVWAVSAGGNGAGGKGVVTLPDGSAIVTGYFFGSITFAAANTVSGSAIVLNDVSN